MHKLRPLSLLLLAWSGCTTPYPDRIFPDNLQHDYDGDGYTELEGDCDDQDPTTHRNATEYCDNVDNDCNGTQDDEYAEDATAWYADFDQDGFGNPYQYKPACTQPQFFVNNAEDCDDTAIDVFPGADE